MRTKILLVTPYFDEHPRRFLPAQAGARFLAAKGVNVIVVTSLTYNYPSFEVRDNIKIFRLKPFLYLSSIPYVIDPTFWIKVIKIGRREKVIAGIATMPQSFTTFMLAMATIFWKLPFAIWVTGAGTSSGRLLVDWIMKIYDFTLLRFSVKRATQVWSLSEALNELIITWGARPSQIRTVPCQTIDLNMFIPKINAPLIREKWNIPPQDKVVTFIGRLYPLKGTNYLIDASLEILKNHPQTRFIIVSHGPQYDTLKSQAQTISPGKFTFTGWVDESQIHEILSITDVFVLPSLSEGLPTVILEAYAYEIPVVATDVGATRDILRDELNGYLITPRDPAAISQAVLKIIKNEDLSKAMGKRNREFVAKYFAKTDDQMGELLLTRLNEMTDSISSLYGAC